MTYRQLRSLFSVVEFAAWAAFSPFELAGLVTRLIHDRFLAGWAAGRTAQFTLHQQRERYDTDDLIAEQSRTVNG